MKKITGKELLDQAKKGTKRQRDGHWHKADLHATLKKLLIEVIDLDEEADRRATTIIDGECKPGSTKATGQLRLPTLEYYDYEPNRLVMNDNGDIIEQDRAPVDFKFAEARRARKHVSEALEWADRKDEEASGHATWVIEQQKNGRTKKLTFGDYIRESGLFQPFEEVSAA